MELKNETDLILILSKLSSHKQDSLNLNTNQNNQR